MYTRCPTCDAELRVDVATLAHGHGAVACRLCGARFNALLRLAECANTSNPPAARALQATEAPEQTNLFDAPGTPPPPFTRLRHRVERSHSNRSLVGLCALLMLLLGAQMAYAAHQSRIEHAALRHALTELCRPIGCSPLPRRDPRAIALISSDVRQHPTVEDALLITGSLTNHSDVPVALPVLEIVLADLSDRRIAMRRFHATEYAPDAELGRRGLQPGSILPVTFEVEDPGHNAVAFSFAFH